MTKPVKAWAVKDMFGEFIAICWTRGEAKELMWECDEIVRVDIREIERKLR